VREKYIAAVDPRLTQAQNSMAQTFQSAADWGNSTALLLMGMLCVASIIAFFVWQEK
jgi:hypothetical protein